MNILLDYFFPITTIDPTPAASTAFLKQACVVVKPSGSNMTEPLLCTSMAAVNAVTANTEAQQLFDAGMSRVYILAVADLDIAIELTGHESDFYTLLISSDFADADVDQVKAHGTVTISSYANLLITTADTVEVAGVVFTAQSAAVTLGDATFQAVTDNDTTATSLCAQINAHAVAKTKVLATVSGAVVTVTAVGYGATGNSYTLVYTDNGSDIGATVSGSGTLASGSGLEVGAFGGVIGISSTDDTYLEALAVKTNYAAFHTTSGNKAKNMFYAFGKLLSNALNWLNQQYITMPYDDAVATLGDATNYFDNKVSFVIDDDQYGLRLALFACGSGAIVAPYIKRNLQIDMQSAALAYISANEPQYTKTQAALLENSLQAVVDSYIDKKWISAGTVSVLLEQSNFVASGYIDISEPTAMWRIVGQMSQTL